MTQTITAMIQTHPTEIRYDRQLLEECIAACVECAPGLHLLCGGVPQLR